MFILPKNNGFANVFVIEKAQTKESEPLELGV
jgi:hypothetical protein